MNKRTQTRVIDKLIAHDEMEAATLAAKITAADHKGGVSPSARWSLQIAAWQNALMLLSQGLEGLRLKHDALEELENKASAAAGGKEAKKPLQNGYSPIPAALVRGRPAPRSL